MVQVKQHSRNNKLGGLLLLTDKTTLQLRESWEKMGRHMAAGQEQLGEAEEKHSKKGHVVNI